jgi:hypothetical protein
VHSPQRPGEGFQPVEPDLEDVYFATIRQHDATFNHDPAK